MDVIGNVRRLKLRDKLSTSAIARATGLSRNTVKKWLKAPGDIAPKYAREAPEGKLSPFKVALDQALKTDMHRPKKGRRTGRALFAQIQAQGYRGGYSAVTDFVRAWHEQSSQSPGKAFVPLSFELGEAFQFDWSDEALVVGGVFYNMQVSHLKLCASRAFWLVAYPSQGHEMLFDAHTRSFTALGGIARRGIYDNMKTAVDKVKKGKGRIVNARFSTMCSHYLFDPDFCNVASGWEKGVVEKNVQDSRRRIWIEAGTRRFGSFVELNAWLGERCRAVWEDTVHPIHKQFTVSEMLELERAHLMSMPAPFDGYVEKPARVSSTCLVSVGRNRYSVPCEWAGSLVSTRLYPNRVDVANADMVIASHARLVGKSQTTYDWQHYIDLVQRKPGALRNGAPFLDLPLPLLRLRQSLLRHTGGDRVMAQVLAAVPQFGLESVLVAVELVLESSAPNGSISAEHVRNVLARLSAPQTPEQAQTDLKLTLIPRADTARYDRLRPTHQDGLEVNHA
ncbi:IS21 family transposase [Rhodoferax lacus]|uniref:IS21 family transposase n=1 Tax=Rhodoferax lacus TaxID=2184758 RepID=A0A3E1R5F8_9BURK|nr:IS21 family transposase [Rhodoferax lacus]RFO94608.1 IS21 family transposase [Rhodoferax lacus]